MFSNYIVITFYISDIIIEMLKTFSFNQLTMYFRQLLLCFNLLQHLESYSDYCYQFGYSHSAQLLKLSSFMFKLNRICISARKGL